MEPEKDFKELLRLLNSKSVEFIIVGAYALAFHGAPRFTGDLVILIRPSKTNSKKIIEALRDFGFVSRDLSESDFLEQDNVIQIGVPPVRVDFLTSITGVDWHDVDDGKAAGEYGGIPVFFIGRNEYIENKRAVGRFKDLADIEALGEDRNELSS